MKDTVSNKGFDLYMMEIDTWVFDDHSGVIFDGTFYDVVKFLVVNGGFTLHDIQSGIDLMLALDNDSIHFGMYKTAMYSFERKSKAA